jgi:hypothetical protein
MTPGEDTDQARHLLSQVASRKTTESFKRTFNAAILLRAARPTPQLSTVPQSTVPRKLARTARFLGLAGLLVTQHEASLRTLIHHIQL